MKTLLIALAALVVFVGSAPEASARHRHNRHCSHHARYHRPAYYGYNPYYYNRGYHRTYRPAYYYDDYPRYYGRSYYSRPRVSFVFGF